MKHHDSSDELDQSQSQQKVQVEPSTAIQLEQEMQRQIALKNGVNKEASVIGKAKKYKIYIILAFILGIVTISNAFLVKNQQREHLTIKTLEGRKIQLPYLNSQFYKLGLMTEPPLTQIKFRNVTTTKQLVDKITTKEQQVEFSAKLFMNWFEDNKTLYRMEYYRLNQTYNLDRRVPERRLCIMAPFRNLLKYGTDGSYKVFLKSLDAQNYSNYRVYMIDDASTDNSTQTILAQLPNYPRLSNRLRILKNRQPIGALGNRDSTTRNYCRPGDIVVDIDGDDSLVGRQTFNLLNRLYYNNPQAWFVYTNFISIKGEEGGDGRVISLNASKATPGPCRQIKPKYMITNTYRTEISEWVTSQLRSYLYDLYMKIPLNYVLEIDTGKYYLQASDRFSMYALAELAGINHTFFFEQYTYFYYQPNYKALQTLSCTLPILFHCEAQSRILTPLRPLSSLSQAASPIQFYSIPKKILKYYIETQKKLEQCRQKLEGVDETFEQLQFAVQ